MITVQADPTTLRWRTREIYFFEYQDLYTNRSIPLHSSSRSHWGACSFLILVREVPEGDGGRMALKPKLPGGNNSLHIDQRLLQGLGISQCSDRSHQT
jgi:hypothetical protein